MMILSLKKKFIGISLIFTIALILTGVYIYKGNKPIIEVNSFPNHAIYDDANKLAEDSELIVIGEPSEGILESKATINYNDAGRYANYYSITNVKVSKVIKGNHENKTVPVMQKAALDKKQNVLLVSDDYSPMEKGKKYFLFLKKTTLEGLDGVYYVQAVNQGKFNIDNLDAKEKDLEDHNSQYKALKQSVLNQFKDKLN